MDLGTVDVTFPFQNYNVLLKNLLLYLSQIITSNLVDAGSSLLNLLWSFVILLSWLPYILFSFYSLYPLIYTWRHRISPGSSLHPTTPPRSWPSPSGQYAFGFYQQGNGFMVGIWLVGIDDNTVVWTANRDDHPVTSNATGFDRVVSFFWQLMSRERRRLSVLWCQSLLLMPACLILAILFSTTKMIPSFGRLSDT